MRQRLPRREQRDRVAEHALQLGGQVVGFATGRGDREQRAGLRERGGHEEPRAGRADEIEIGGPVGGTANDLLQRGVTVDTRHHLIVAHEVTNVGSDRDQLSDMTDRARVAIGSEAIEVVADRGYYKGEEIVAYEQAGNTVYLPKPMTSGLYAKGRFGKQDFVYVAADDIYLCPAGEQLTYHYTNEQDGKTLRRYWTTACEACALKSKCTTGKERRISRWEHEAVLEVVQARLDRSPEKMRLRRQTVEHTFGTIKSWMGSTHFLMKRLKNVRTEMALHVLAYNMKRVMRILGVGGLMEAIRA